MNKKLLILGAIATGILLTACVKKESPSENEQEQTTASQVEQTDFKPLEATEEEVTIAPHVEVERIETQNTTTEVRREVQQPAAQPESVTPAAQQTETKQAPNAPQAEEKPTPAVQKPAPVTPKPVAANTQSEEDAVAAAIAAATPALKK